MKLIDGKYAVNQSHTLIQPWIGYTGECHQLFGYRIYLLQMHIRQKVNTHNIFPTVCKYCLSGNEPMVSTKVIIPKSDNNNVLKF